MAFKETIQDNTINNAAMSQDSVDVMQALDQTKQNDQTNTTSPIHDQSEEDVCNTINEDDADTFTLHTSSATIRKPSDAHIVIVEYDTFDIQNDYIVCGWQSFLFALLMVLRNGVNQQSILVAIRQGSDFESNLKQALFSTDIQPAMQYINQLNRGIKELIKMLNMTNLIQVCFYTDEIFKQKPSEDLLVQDIRSFLSNSESQNSIITNETLQSDANLDDTVSELDTNIDQEES